MKTPNTSPKSKARYFLIIGVALVIIIAGFIVYTVLAYNANQNDKKDPSVSNEKSIDSNKIENTPTEGLPSNSTETTTDQVPTGESLSVSIKSFSQTDGKILTTAQTNNNGTCSFTYKPADNGKPVTRQTTVSNNLCEVEIPENEFAYIGNWLVHIVFYNNGQKVEVEQNVSVR
jgi:cytoskeletal protein RodZ